MRFAQVIPRGPAVTGRVLLGIAVTGGLAGCAVLQPAATGAGRGQTAAVTTGDLPSGPTSLLCRDAGKALEPVDLTRVDVGHPAGGDGAGLTVRFQLSSAVPAAGVRELALGLYDRAGTPREILAIRLGSGPPHLLAYRPDSGTEQALPGTPSVQGTSVSASFPVTPATVTGGAWWWRAVAEVDGSTVDACPDG